MKKIFLLLILAIAIKITLGQDTIIKTPTGVSVPAEIETVVYSEGQVAYAYNFWENKIADSSWNATIIELNTLSAQYNCHGYAWHVSDGGNKVRIEGGPGPYIEDENASYIQTSSTKNLRKVYYNGGGHSAITTETSGIVISKWGWGPLVRHAVNDCPYRDYYGHPVSYTLEYYEIPMSGAQSALKRALAAKRYASCSSSKMTTFTKKYNFLTSSIRICNRNISTYSEFTNQVNFKLISIFYLTPSTKCHRIFQKSASLI